MGSRPIEPSPTGWRATDGPGAGDRTRSGAVAELLVLVLAALATFAVPVGPAAPAVPVAATTGAVHRSLLRPVVARIVPGESPEPVIRPAIRGRYASWMPLLQGGLEVLEDQSPGSGPATVLTLASPGHEELQTGRHRFGVDSLQGVVADGSGRTWAANLLTFGPGRGGDVLLVGRCRMAVPAVKVPPRPVRQACAGLRIEFPSDFLPQTARVATFRTARTVQWVAVAPAGSYPGSP